jgi:hypothetical protein
MNSLPMSGKLGDEQVQEACEFVTGHPRWKDWEIEDEQLGNALRSLKSPTIADLTDAIFRLPAGTKPRWGDKTPGYVQEIARLHQLFPNAKFIHMIRDGRDVCVSLKRIGWHGRVTMQLARYWRGEVEAGRRLGQKLPAGLYMELSYEDLVRNPEHVLRRVCSFLGEDFEEGMLRFYESADEQIPSRLLENHAKTRRPPSPSDLERWRRELKPAQVLMFETIAGRTMERVGHVVHFKRITRILRPGVNVLEWAARRAIQMGRRIGQTVSRFFDG